MSLLLDRFPVLASRFQRKGRVRHKPGLRPDIQGLRAFAVIAVILDHLLGWPKGGFVGVDIFFVISGFVITASLLREFERMGRISFIEFYKRRIKRIMPAAVLVLIVTMAASYFAFSTTRFLATLWDAVAAFLFSANWRFAAAGTDYFQIDGPISPLQHYWSLAVEEQFYFVWPAVMAVVLALVARRAGGPGRTRVAAGIAIGLLTAASLAWAIYETATNANLAYFSTLSRGWELGVGAALAIAAPAFTTIPARLRPALAWLGLVGMALSLFVIDASVGFPAPAAALPVLATALVIAAGTGTSEYRGLSILTNIASRYVGDISYSLYLWHFPIIIIGRVLFADSPYFYPAAAAMMLVVSYYSYELLEDPIRTSSWLSAKKTDTRDRAARPGSYKYKALSLLAVVTVAVSAAALAKSASIDPKVIAEQVAAARTNGPAASEPAAALPTAGPAVTDLQHEIAAALTSHEWPTLTPTMDEAIASDEVSADLTTCGGSSFVDPTLCTFGDNAAPKTALIVGDSISMTYASVLRDVVDARPEWKIQSYGTFGCLFTSVQITSGSIGSKCADKNQAAVDAINETRPDVVIIANHYLPRAVDGQSERTTPDAWASSMQAQVAKFKAAGSKIVFLASPPAEVNISECYSKVSSPADCITRVNDQWQLMADTEQALAAATGGTWIDSRPWFCVDGSCPSFVGQIPMKIDRNHMTQEYGRHIAPAVAETLTEKGVF